MPPVNDVQFKRILELIAKRNRGTLTQAEYDELDPWVYGIDQWLNRDLFEVFTNPDYAAYFKEIADSLQQ